MDKNTFARYGWIVCIVIVLIILMRLAVPFGKFIVTSIQSAAGNLAQKANSISTPLRSLGAPKNLRVVIGETSDLLMFDSVPGAVGYVIKIGNNEPFISDATTVDITEKLADVEGSVDITVYAFNEQKDGSLSAYTHWVPGLYRTGSNYTELITPWRTLVSNEVIHVDNGIVYTNFSMDAFSTFALVEPALPINSSAEHLSGDLVLPHDGSISSIGCASVDMEEVVIEGDVAFGFCEYLTGIKIPSSVTLISDGAFLGCSSLMEIQIPDSVKFIGCAVFMECFSLKSVIISNNITEIKEDTFAFCETLTSVKLPDNLKEMGRYAFLGCYSLEIVNVPQSVETIEAYAFCDCASLKNFSISKNVKYIGEEAFSGCYELVELSVSPENERYKIVDNCLVDADTQTVIFALDESSS